MKHSHFYNNLVFFLILITFIALIFNYEKRGTKTLVYYPTKVVALSPKKAEEILRSKALLTIKAIKFRHLKLLSTLIHPEKGIRFSPHAYITNGVVLDRNNLVSDYEKNIKYNWGISNDMVPINLGFQEYYDNYVYDQDYANADKISFNEKVLRKNIIDNARKIYPNSIMVDFKILEYVNKEMLRLIFEKEIQDWYLVAIVKL